MDIFKYHNYNQFKSNPVESTCFYKIIDVK